jgi:diguanylate cyclase (GGDEF)-like protein
MHESGPPERFAVAVSSELSQETLQQRWRDVNVLLRLSMLSGLEMHLDSTFNLLCDFAGEIAPYQRALVYFWDESGEQVRVGATRGMDQIAAERYASGNIMNFWATKQTRPLLVKRGQDPHADAFLDVAGCGAALVLPLFVGSRVMGTLQLFARDRAGFTHGDAQLLWILSLVAENLLTREHTHEDLIRFAFTDYLTGLKTRGYFEQQLDLEIKRSGRRTQHFALLMIDIDHFKSLNDQYGHHVGDQVLREVTALLMKDMREVDTAARYGGEEFVIILPETNRAGAILVAERLRRTVEQSKFFADSARDMEKVTISIGISIFDTDAQFKKDLIESADAALYAAKSQGRNQVVLYSDLADRQHQQAS